MRISQGLSFIFLVNVLASVCVNDEYCRSCPSGVCQYCAEGYVSKTDNMCVKVSNAIQNCVFYASEGKCDKCRIGYQTDTKGLCVPITIANCANVDPETGICTTCNAGIREKNGQCLPENKCTLANCQYCYNFGGIEYCYLCEAGYTSYKSPSTGPVCRKQTSDFTMNCDMALSSDIANINVCLTCSPGYYFSIDRCVKSSKQISISNSAQVTVIMWLSVLLGIVLAAN